MLKTVLTALLLAGSVGAATLSTSTPAEADAVKASGNDQQELRNSRPRPPRW